MKRYNIKPQNVLGHSDIAPSRKKDPGEKFPWSKLAKKKLCIWHNLDINKIKDFRKVKLDVYQENIFLKNLKKIGYFEKGKSNDKKMNIVKAFQRKFRQKLINGKIDQECLLISKNLLK